MADQISGRTKATLNRVALAALGFLSRCRSFANAFIRSDTSIGVLGTYGVIMPGVTIAGSPRHHLSPQGQHPRLRRHAHKGRQR
jgi:hypothetical protein